ncbi:MAG: hypothetical protein Q9160_000588 [Pyrenula sp. 1 TL-2023]
MNFESLPNEVLALIAAVVHPSTIVSYALTSKRIWKCSVKALELHRTRLSYRFVHDRSPQGVVSLLRSLIGDTSLSWYIRRLESWAARDKWEGWKPLTFVNAVESTRLLTAPEEAIPEIDNADEG